MALITSVLGPGMLRADRFAAGGTVGAGAHVLLTAQSATRVFGGGASWSEAIWRLDDGATLEVVNEPLVPFAGADSEARTTIEARGGAMAVLLDIIAIPAQTPCDLRSRTQIVLDGRLAVHDRMRLRRDGTQPSLAIGTLVICRAMEETRSCALAGAAERAGTGAASFRYGVGTLRRGGILVRAVGPRPWEIRAFLHGAREAALRIGGFGCEPLQGSV